MDADIRETISPRLYLNDKYIRNENGNLCLDDNLLKIDIINFKVCCNIYGHYTNILRQQMASGYNISVSTYTKVTVSEAIAAKPSARVSFKELFDEYCRHRSTGAIFIGADYYADLIVKKNPLVKEAYDKLGESEVKRLQYKTSNICREIAKKSDTTTIGKVIMLSDKVFKKGVPIPVHEVKSKLQAIYNDLAIVRTAKATDLNS